MTHARIARKTPWHKIIRVKNWFSDDGNTVLLYLILQIANIYLCFTLFLHNLDRPEKKLVSLLVLNFEARGISICENYVWLKKFQIKQITISE